MNDFKPQRSQRTQKMTSVLHHNPSAFICVHLRLIFVSLSARVQKIQNELMPSEFVPVRFSSLFFSCSFMNHNSWPTLRTLWCLILLKNKPKIPSRASEGRRHVCPAGIQGLRPLRTRPRMPVGIRVHAIDWRGSRRGFPLPKGNRDADERRFVICESVNFTDIFICINLFLIFFNTNSGESYS